MRFKLILLTSLIAAVIGAGASIGLILGGLGSIDFAYDSTAYRSFSWIALIIYVPPLLAAILAGVFVYRHTASRRKLQGTVTTLLVVLLSLAVVLTLRSV